MTALLNAFITAVDTDGNQAKINTYMIKHITGKCPPAEYAKNDGKSNRVRISQYSGHSWITKETPEEIYTKICQAQSQALKGLKQLRLNIPLSLDFYNALVPFTNADGFTMYIPADNIERIDNEISDELENTNSRIRTTENGVFYYSADKQDELDVRVQEAHNKRLKQLQGVSAVIR